MENILPMLLLAGIAMICDLRTGKIPNHLLLVSLLFGLGYTIVINGTSGLLVGLSGFATGFLLLLPGYLLRFTGAGDLKLMAVLGIFGGPVTILWVFALSVIAGALSILLKILWRAVDRIIFLSSLKAPIIQALLMSGRFDVLFFGSGAVLKQRLPMAPFYAMGCLLCLLIQPV